MSAYAAEHLRGLLPMPPLGSTAVESAAYEEAFNQLARFRLERINRPDADGTTRWRCPFHAGRLRSRAVAETMRGPAMHLSSTSRTDHAAATAP